MNQEPAPLDAARGTLSSSTGGTGILVRTFLSRFFENEITGGSNDLRQSFFWLLALLATIGWVMAMATSVGGSLIARLVGVAALELLSRSAKVSYLGLAMIAPAMVSAVVWNSLLIDRRDALILGALPVRPAVVVRAKLAALTLYMLMVAVGMHAAGSLVWGFTLAAGNTLTFALVGAMAHFVASCAATLFVVLALAGLQGAALAIAGPRWFARVSPLLQIALIAAIGASLFVLPAIATSTVSTVIGVFGVPHPPQPNRFGIVYFAAADVHPWILYSPPVWFLGLYEWLLGVRDASVSALVPRALAALAVAGALTTASYGIAYRRVMRHAIEDGGAGGLVGRSAAGLRWLARLVVRRPRARAVAEFLLLTMARVERQRFALAIGLGAAIVWACPTVIPWMKAWPLVPRSPATDLLTLPLAMMLIILIALRIAASLPADLRASWIFDEHPPTERDVRSVMERLMFTIGVAPMIAIFLPIHWWLWGPRVAWMHAGFAGAMSLLLIQMLLRRFSGVPCSQPWRPERAQLRFRGPVYVPIFLWFATGMYVGRFAFEATVLRFPALFWVSLAGILTSAFVLRWRTMHDTAEPFDDDVLGAPAVLRLS